MTLLELSEGSRRVVSWLERSWFASILCCMVLGGLLALGYFFGVPGVADRLAVSISIEQERAIGRAALDSLGGIQASKVPPAQSQAIERAFQELSRGLPLSAHYRLVFDGRQFANAFAFPGGTIVITDGLLENCSAEEVAAVLAHEIGHIEHRHSLRQSLRNSGLSILLGALISESSSVSIATSGIARRVAFTRYSRAFEEEADDFAFRLLLAHDRKPDSLGSCLERIAPSAEEPSRWQFLSSHPHTATRAKRARAVPEANPERSPGGADSRCCQPSRSFPNGIANSR